jgi:hypothetical protein
VRAQLLIVYTFSGLEKLVHGFGNGASLANLLGLAQPAASILSWIVIVSELAIPFILIQRPKTGIACAAALHTLIAFAMPGLWSFSLVMVAMAVLFLRDELTPRIFARP